MPATLESLRTFLGYVGARPQDDDALSMAVAAANGAVLSYRADLSLDEQWPVQCDYGATILAANLYGRRGSLGGIQSFQDTGVALIPDMDPTVKFLLGLGRFQKSVVA